MNSHISFFAWLSLTRIYIYGGDILTNFREDHRRWFIQKEIELFKLKFQSETPAARLAFFKSCNFGFQEVQAEI